MIFNYPTINYPTLIILLCESFQLRNYLQSLNFVFYLVLNKILQEHGCCFLLSTTLKHTVFCMHFSIVFVVCCITQEDLSVKAIFYINSRIPTANQSCWYILLLLQMQFITTSQTIFELVHLPSGCMSTREPTWAQQPLLAAFLLQIKYSKQVYASLYK